MQQQKLCLKWNNHTANLLEVLGTFRQTDILVDVTISCEGRNIKAHKMVLSACSPYFQNIFLENPCQHPIVIINGMKYEDVTAILNFMYKGEVNVSHDGLSSFLQAAEALKVRGLAEVCGDKNSASQESEQPEQSQPQRAETPNKKRHRNRKRSLSDSNKSDDEGAVPRKQKDINSPEVHDLSGDEAFTGDTMSSNGQLNSRLRQNTMYSRSHQSSNVIVEEMEDEYEVEPTKLLEQTLTENVSMNNSTSSDNLRIEQIMGNATEMESSSLQEPESPPDIKPIIEYGESSSGPSEGNILPYNEQSQPGPSSVQDSSLLHDNSHTQGNGMSECCIKIQRYSAKPLPKANDLLNNLRDGLVYSCSSSVCKETLGIAESEELLKRSKHLYIINKEGHMRGIDPYQEKNWNSNSNQIKFLSSPASFSEDSNDSFKCDQEPINNFLCQQSSPKPEKNINYFKKPSFLPDISNKESLSKSSQNHNYCQIFEQKDTVKKKRGRKKKEVSLTANKKSEIVGRKPKRSLIERYSTDANSGLNNDDKKIYSIDTTPEISLSSAVSKTRRPRRKVETKSAREMLMIKRRKKKVTQSSTSYFQEMMSSELETLDVDVFENPSSHKIKIAKASTKRPRRPNYVLQEKYGPEVVPPGWKIIHVRRKSGKTAGIVDVYFITPEGERMRSRVQIAKYIEKRNLPFKAEEFCFRKSAYESRADYEEF